MKISATIVTLNEERNLARAIESLICVDEILVVDSGSTDRTLQIARRYGVRVLSHAWPGYAQQKNFAAAQATHDWILSIDADEALSEVLQAEIMALRALEPKLAGYRFPRRAQYLGGWISHSGWYPDSKVRLYDRRYARWTGDYVHESVFVEGDTGVLTGDLHHFTCDSLEAHRRTMERYTTLAAEEMRADGRQPGWLRMQLSPAATFLKTYFVQQGFRDGYRGFLIAKMAARYVRMKHEKSRMAE